MQNSHKERDCVEGRRKLFGKKKRQKNLENVTYREYMGAIY